MLAGEKLTDFISLFSPHDFQKNDSIILSYFQDEWNRWDKLDWSNKISTKWSKQIILTKKLIKENYAVKKSTNILLLLIT